MLFLFLAHKSPSLSHSPLLQSPCVNCRDHANFEPAFFPEEDHDVAQMTTFATFAWFCFVTFFFKKSP